MATPAASLDDVKHWFQTDHGLSNATIVLAGGIHPKTAREKVEDFGAIPPVRQLPVLEQRVPKTIGVRRQQMQDRVPQARIYKAWNLPPFGTADATHIGMLASVLAGESRHGSTSGWSTAIDWPPTSTCTSTTARLPVSCLSGPLPSQAVTSPWSRALDEEVTALLARGPTPTEIARVQTDYRARFVRVERIGGPRPASPTCWPEGRCC